jgi:hypothetical protein
MLDVLFELQEQAVHEELRAQEGLLLDGAVEEALELHVPEEVLLILPREEVSVKDLCEVIQYALECNYLHPVEQVSHLPMEQNKEVIVSVEHLQKHLGVFLPEYAALELSIGNGLSLLHCINFDVVELLWMLNHHVQPYVVFNLSQHVREVEG